MSMEEIGCDVNQFFEGFFRRPNQNQVIRKKYGRNIVGSLTDPQSTVIELPTEIIDEDTEQEGTKVTA